MDGDVQRFFEQYARAAGGADVEDLAAFHDDHVLHASPSGAFGFRNDARYRAWLRRRIGVNLDAGLLDLAAVGVGSYDIGPALAIATVQWRATYERADRPVESTMTYLLRRAPDGLRVLCVVGHEDTEETLRSRGLLGKGRPAKKPGKRVRRAGTVEQER